MVIVRPVRESDLEALLALSAQAKTGLTTLPHDRDHLKRRVASSANYFSKIAERPGGEDYLFVMEDIASGDVVGTCAVFSKVGGYQPFWTYEIKIRHTRSESLNIANEIRYLQLKKIHDGPTEIGSLFLHPDYRKGTNGRLLSLSRFLFMAQNPNAFEAEVIAELRGVITEEGKSPFWEAFGRHFFHMDLGKADLMSARDKHFIDELMPIHPVYIPLLPQDAQLVIGQVHPDTRPAMRLLEQEGFSFCNEIDIFEAGPTVSCQRDDIRTITQSRIQPFVRTINQEDHPLLDDRSFMITKEGGVEDYAVTVSQVMILDDGIAVDADVAKGLGLKNGDSVRFSPLRAVTKR